MIKFTKMFLQILLLFTTGVNKDFEVIIEVYINTEHTLI